MTIETANFEAILGGCFIRSTTAPKGPWTQFTQHRYHLVQSKYGKTQHVRHVSLKVYCRVLTQHTLQNRLVYTSWHLFQPSAFALAFDFPLTQITFSSVSPHVVYAEWPYRHCGRLSDTFPAALLTPNQTCVGFPPPKLPLLFHL